MRVNTCIALCMTIAFMTTPALGAFLWGVEPVEAAGPKSGEAWWGSGWIRRAPVNIDNRQNPNALFNYQVPINVSYASRMMPDFSDLRFVQTLNGTPTELPFWLESKQDGKNARVWVNVGHLGAQSITVVHMYYGNPSAGNASDGTSTFDFFDDFNGPGLDSNKWNPLHTQNAAVSLSVNGGMLDFNVVTGYQWTGGCVISKTALPKASYITETKLKFTDYYQSAFGAYAGFTNGVAYNDSAYGVPAKLVSAKLWDYTKNGWYLVVQGDDIPGTIAGSSMLYGSTLITIRNTWFRMVTIYTPGTYVKGIWTQLDAPFSEQSLELSGTGGIDPTYITCGVGEYQTNEHTYFDYVIVHKYSAVVPGVSMGPEERPFSFKSLQVGPADVSERDNVNISVAIDNPTSMYVPVSLSLRLGAAFDTATEFGQADVQLAPQMVTHVPWNWTALGGRNTIWCGLDGEQTASTILDVNRYPLMGRLPDRTLSEDKEFLMEINASDADGDQLEWSDDTGLFDITSTGKNTAQIIFTPTNDEVGIYAVNISVKDPHNCSNSTKINFTVKNLNDPPALSTIPSLLATQYTEFRYMAKASDVDIKWGDVLTFSDNTDIFDIDGKTGEFSFTPTEELVGKRTIKITVTDSEGALDTRSFTLTVANVNDPPAVEFLADQVALQGRPFLLKVAATDPDPQSDPTERLRFSDDCPLFNIGNDTGSISFTPSNDDLGVYRANITVTDRGGLSATTPLVITVMNANDPPTIDAIPAQTATEDQPFQYQALASDPDLKWGLDNLTFSDDTDLFNIDPKTGVMAVTPAGAQVGSRRITITVKDERGATASASFELTVVHVNHMPFNVTIRYPTDGARLKEGDQMWLEGSAKDLDKADELEFTWLDNGNAVGVGKNISVVLKPGKHAITLEVSDGTGMAKADVSVDVAKKEVITVAGGSDWTLMVGAAFAVVAVLAIIGVLAARRKRKPQEQEALEAARVSPISEGETVELPPIPPAEAARQEPGSGEEAKKMIGSTLDRLSDYQETHPDEALDVGPVMEKLDIARGFLKSGEYDDALAFAMEADAAVKKMTQHHAPKRVAVKKKKAVAARKNCPGCGEELQQEWTACPACGRKT